MSFLSGAMILAGGVFVVAISFGIAWVLVWLVSGTFIASIGSLNDPLQLPAAFTLAGAAALVGVLFLANRRLNRGYSRPSRRRLTREEIENHSPEELVHLLAYPGASSHPISDFLFTGPRLVGIGLDHLRKAGRLWRLDPERGAWLLCLLASRPGKVTFSELSSLCGVADLERLRLQMADLDGVLLLYNEPPGLGLTSDLRRELTHVGWAPELSDLDDARDTGLHPAATRSGGIGGPEPAATLEEFEQAYRQRLRTRVGTGADDPNAGAIQAAYQAFLEQRTRPQSGPRNENVERVWARYRQTKD